MYKSDKYTSISHKKDNSLIVGKLRQKEGK